MALAHVILAALVGILVAIYGAVTGQVSFLGAVALYCGAGWASIIAALAVGIVARALRRPGQILIDRQHSDVRVLFDRCRTEKLP
jgi:hypothetical protein